MTGRVLDSKIAKAKWAPPAIQIPVGFLLRRIDACLTWALAVARSARSRIHDD